MGRRGRVGVALAVSAHGRVMRGAQGEPPIARAGVMQVDVHYAFLSGFVHPAKRGYEAIFGGNSPDRMGSFDHYASELALLYVIVLAAAEIEIYGRMASVHPPIVSATGRTCRWRSAERSSPRPTSGSCQAAPEMFDRIDTAHTPPGNWKPKVVVRRSTRVRSRRCGSATTRNPLGRLVKLHQSYRRCQRPGSAHRSSDRTRGFAKALRTGRTGAASMNTKSRSRHVTLPCVCPRVAGVCQTRITSARARRGDSAAADSGYPMRNAVTACDPPELRPSTALLNTGVCPAVASRSARSNHLVERLERQILGRRGEMDALQEAAGEQALDLVCRTADRDESERRSGRHVPVASRIEPALLHGGLGSMGA